MFDVLLKSKFYSKCKSNIKMIRTRIEMIKRKRNATQKYLRNDVADLLKNGFDYNAYGRAEGLLAEMSRSQCYELIDQYCDHISKHLSAMDKQRECPEDCREAASSLMFAAARFADLPELRELRTMFSERYGNSLDHSINKQFAEKLKSGPPKDTKLQLLQDIAAESGLEWDSKALENNLFSDSAYNKNIAKETSDSEYSSDDHMDGSVRKKGGMGTRHDFYPAREISPESKKDNQYNNQKEASRNEDSLPRRKESASPWIDEIGPPVKDIQVDTIGKRGNTHEPSPVIKTPNKGDEDKPLKYKWIPPPYTKSEVNETKEKVKLSEPSDAEENLRKDDPILKAKPMGKSVRTRIVNPSLVEETGGGLEGDGKERENETNKDKAALGQRILKFLDKGGHDQRDEEEKMMDKLLRHFSRKNGAFDEGELESDLKPTPQRVSTGSSRAGKHRSRDGPNRVSSLPTEPTPPIETPKTHTRAASFHPDNAHVHPKLPDYDDFVARMAAFRGK